MKNIIFIVLFHFLSLPLFSQKIDYSLPRSLQKVVSQKEYRHLLKHTIFQLEGFDLVKVQEGDIHFQLGEYPYTLSLAPIIQQYAGSSIDQQQEVVQQYVSTLIDAYYDQQMLVEAGFETAKNYLSLRLYPANAVDKYSRERWVVRSDLEGTLTCVTLNLPTAFASLERDRLAEWGVSEEEVYSFAQKNSEKRSYQIHHQQLDDSIKLVALTGNDYAGSAALILEQVIPEAVGHYGTIVSIPHNDIVLLHNIDDETSDYQTFIEQTYDFVLEQYSQHAAPVSPDFYWYYRGKFTRILLGKDQYGHLQIVPPGFFSQRRR